MRTIFALVFAVLVFATLFIDLSDAGHMRLGKKKRLIKKLVKGALVAKVLKPKLLPLPIPIPIPIGIHKSIGLHHGAIAWPQHEPVWAPEFSHHGGFDSYGHGGW